MFGVFFSMAFVISQSFVVKKRFTSVITSVVVVVINFIMENRLVFHSEWVESLVPHCAVQGVKNQALLASEVVLCRVRHM